MNHVARLTNPADFDPAALQAKEIASGVTLRTGTRKGSKTVEGVEYQFDAKTFTPDDATAWLTRNKIRAQAVEFASVDDGRDLKIAVLAPGNMSASVGGDVELTDEMLARCVDDTNALIEMGHLRPPTKIGHGGDQDKWAGLFPKGGAPATGRIEKLSREGRKVYFQVKAVSSKFADLVASGAYGPVSAELVENWTDPLTKKTYPLIVKALAWLGDKMPAVPLHEILGLSFDEGKPLTVLLASNAQDVAYTIHFAEADPIPEGIPTDPGSPEVEDPANQPTGDAGAVATEMQVTCPKCGMQMRITSTGQLEVESEPEETPQEPVSPEGEEDMSEDTKALQAQVDALKTRMVERELTGLVKDRRITPAQSEALKPRLIEMSLENAEAQIGILAQNPQGPDLTKPVAGQDVPETPKQSTLTGGDRIVELANSLVAEGKAKDVAEATVMAYRMEPEAAAVYDRQATRPKSGKEA